MVELRLSDAAARDDLGTFVARGVRLDSGIMIRLKSRTDGILEAWAATPFDVLATRAVGGWMGPADATLSGNDLLAGLAVERGETVDPGEPQDLAWRSGLPPVDGWQSVDELPASVVSELADSGIALARDNPGPKGTPPSSLLDQTVLTVHNEHRAVKVPMRCLFALSGMGFVGTGGEDEAVLVSATDSWLRMDARFGAVVRRRQALLPLLV